MREPRLGGIWRRRFWRLAAVAVCGPLLPLWLAHGQAPRDEPRLPARLGAVRAADDKAVSPVEDGPRLPDQIGGKKKPGGEDKDGSVLLYDATVAPPGPRQLFRLESEARFQERLRAEVRRRLPDVRLEFPESDRQAPEGRPVPRSWPDYVKWVEPSYVISKRLFFEQPHFERFGQSLGVFQPEVSTALFGVDLFLWPVRRAVQPFVCYQVNADEYSPYYRLVGE